ncbi:MAG TPA: nuclear transport factor 2 family protein [Bryobacteraceae bacterium]|nr:nuclear transport factor 2 family protein [Bryobacteraceae bacterium]
MPSTEVQKFIGALEQLESSRQHEAMISLFRDDCTVGNVLAPDQFQGKEGATRFWQDYRGVFDEIRSEFHKQVEGANEAALEWVAEGKTPDGKPIRYHGVTVLSFEGGQIKRFMAYFDPRGLGRQVEV